MGKAKERLDNLAGRLCESILPVRESYFAGKGRRIAICSLASIDLLKEISGSREIMDRVIIVARLLSENKGIDTMIQFVLENPSLSHIILCGKEVKGHQAGQALLSMYKNGIDDAGRIIGATGPYPFLKSSKRDVDRLGFRSRSLT